jgi:hypothetical protein
MVERGRARSEAEGYDVDWVEADVEELPFEDGRFDCAELFALGRSYAPPSDGPLSDEWSVEENVRERFDGLAARFEIEIRKLVWHAESPEELVAMLGTSAPPWVAAKQNLPPEKWESMVGEALELASRWAGEARPIELQNEYAQIVARKRG